MKELTWLGKCREEEMDILIVFGLKSAEYFEPPNDLHDEEDRLKADITERYSFLKQQLNPESCALYPIQFQTVSAELSPEIDHTYDLLINPKKYTNPVSRGDILHLHYKKCELTEYILGLKSTKYPNIPHLAYTLNQFLTLKYCFDDYQQLAQKQLNTKDEQIKKLQQENHQLKHLLTAIGGCVEAVEAADNIDL